MVKEAVARGGGGPLPQGPERSEPPPKLRSPPRLAAGSTAIGILCRAARCINILLPRAHKLLDLRCLSRSQPGEPTFRRPGFWRIESTAKKLAPPTRG